MSQVRLIKLKFKPGKKQAWLDWCEELKRHADEVIETLKNEGALSEACFISQNGEDIYYFMEVEDLEKARKVFRESQHKIDKDHHVANEACLDKIEELNPLFYFRNK